MDAKKKKGHKWVQKRKKKAHKWVQCRQTKLEEWQQASHSWKLWTKQTSLLQQAHNSLSFPFLSEKQKKKKKKNKNKKNKLQ